MRWSLCLALGIGVLAAAGGPARAQATAEGAAKLQAALEAWQPSVGKLSLDEIVAVTPKIPVPFSVSDWRVTADGDGYRVEAPGFRWLLSEALDDRRPPFVLACDAETLRATPLADGRFSLDSDRLVSCRLYNVGRIAAKSRRVTGTVDPAAPAKTEITVTLDQATVGGVASPVATIERLAFTRTARAAADGRSDADAKLSISGLSIPFPGGTGTLTVDRILFDAGMPGIDSRGLIQAAVALAKTGGREAGPEVAALQDRLVGGLGDAGTNTLTAEGLRAVRNDVTISLGSLAIGLGYRNFTREGADATFRLDADGIATDPKWAYDAWTPTTMTVQISMEDFPLWEIFADSFANRQIDEEDEDRLFREARMRFLFDTVRLSAPDAALDFGGAITTDPDAVLGQTGTLRMRLTGIDGLVKALQADPQAGQAAAGLSVLQVLGRQTTTPDGRSARDYEIVIDPSGKLLVNGADVQALIPKEL
ncbi:hypothetical protein [Inquilinus sp. Marseille-Q2685]|uniref:hypothetical protein n=1 Tax=Inquilinus sp. Marseille-Q2685 TaxID=2866581 RepID=UPI001CE3C937|nr:hypothetical protein [Inquilinus sp. Marseille-Q2685]